MKPSARAFSWRSVSVGLLGAIGICAFSFFNDHVMKQSTLIPHQVPPVVYAGLFAGVVMLVLAAHWFGPGWAFSGGEWAVIVGLWLMACGLPGWGLAENIPPTAIMPYQWSRMDPNWQSSEVDVVAAIPESLRVPEAAIEDGALDGYLIGDMGQGHMAIADVPWSAWARPMGFWIPFAAAITIAMLGLAVVLHQQWAHHEKLTYPIATFASALLPDADGRSTIYRDRLFWLGAVPVFMLHMVNYIAAWFPENAITIPLRINLTSLYDIMPFLGGPWFKYQLSFAVVGLAYFLRTSVSFSTGIIPYLFTGVTLVLAGTGLNLNDGNHLGGSYNTFLYAGGYVGILLLLIYTGRHYYWSVMRQGLLVPHAGTQIGHGQRRRFMHAGLIGMVASCFLHAIMRTSWLVALPGGVIAGLLHAWAAPKMSVKDPVDPQSVWGFRVFGLALFVFLILLVVAGLDGILAICFTAVAVMIFVVISRAVAETGVFLFGTYVLPGALILGFIGTGAIGPQPLLIMALTGSAILLGPGWAPMPFMVQALRIADTRRVDVTRLAKVGSVVVLIGIPIALAAAIYFTYDHGAPLNSWPHKASTFSGRDMVASTTRLAAQGRLDTVASFGPWERLLHASPNRPYVTAFIIMVILTVLCGWLSMRFNSWPFHPVMFLFLGGMHAQYLSVSLLIGCLVKIGVIRYAGGAVYNRLKPLMIGLIAGSVLAATVPFIVGTIYYLLTSTYPPRLPGYLL